MTTDLESCNRAVEPDPDASLEIEHPRYDMFRHFSANVGTVGVSYGLEKLENIILECPPELNSSILMQLMGNPKSMASNLQSLELRHCHLDLKTIGELLRELDNGSDNS